MKAALIVWDGLRPDFVRPNLTPTLCGLADRGMRFARHSAIFPTETRVNASSIATGCPPATHGIVANRFLDRPTGRLVNTGDTADLFAVAGPEGGILPVPTLSERLSDAGFRTLVVGAGSPGSTLVLAPRSGDPVINVRAFVRPEPDAEAFHARYGPFPEEADPPDPWNDLACRIFVDEIESGGADFGILWLCDPDFTQHKAGLGSPRSLSAIRANDARLADILRRAPGDFTCLVASDHGFSSEAPGHPPQSGWTGLPGDRVTAGSSGVYLADPARDLERVVSVALEADWVGTVFLKAGDGTHGAVEGTLDQSLLGISREDRSPDLVIPKRWEREANEHGVPGLVRGIGGPTHGSLSPFDRSCVLIASGPQFRRGETSSIPSSAVDIAPTVLSLFEQAPAGEGRILVEGLADSAAPTIAPGPTVSSGTARLAFVDVDGRRYLDDLT